MSKQEIIKLLQMDGINSKKKVIEILEQEHIQIINNKSDMNNYDFFLVEKKDTDKESVSKEYKDCEACECKSCENEDPNLTRIDVIKDFVLTIILVAMTLLTIFATGYVLFSIDNSVFRIMVLLGNILIHMIFAMIIMLNIYIRKILKLELHEKVEEYNKSEIKKTVIFYTLTAYILAVIAMFIVFTFV